MKTPVTRVMTRPLARVGPRPLPARQGTQRRP